MEVEDLVLGALIGGMLGLIFFCVVAAFFSRPVPCEPGYIEMKGACVQGYWPGKNR